MPTLAMKGYISNSDDPNDPTQASFAYFGLDADADGLINRAGVYDDSTNKNGSTFGAMAYIEGDGYPLGYDDLGFVGVALVRSSVVPVPAAAWLFCSALIGLVGIGRKR